MLGWPAAVTFALIALAAGVHAVLADEPIAAFAARAAFGVAWTLAVRDAGLGAWRGPADTVLVSLYALTGIRHLRSGRVGRLLSAHRQWLVHASAAAATLLTAADTTGPDVLNWHTAALLGGLSIAYLMFTLLGGRRVGAALGLAAAGFAWGTAGHLLGFGRWQAVAVAAYAVVLVLVAARGDRLGEGGAALARVAGVYVHATVLAALVLGAFLAGGEARLQWATPTLFLVIAAVYAVHWGLLRRHLILLAVAISLSLAVLLAGGVLRTGFNGAAIELLALAVGWAVAAEFAPDLNLRVFLLAGMTIQALVPLAATPDSPPLAAGVLSGSTLLFVAHAVHHRHPGWLLAAGLTATGAWYWAGASILGRDLMLGSGMPGVMAPFALGLGLLALGLRAGLGRRWALPLYLEAAIAMVVVAGGAAGYGLPGVAGTWLLADAAVVYAAAGVERRPEGAVAAAVAALLGAAGLLTASSAAVIWYPVSLGVLSVLLYALQVPWEVLHDRGSAWVLTHRYLGLGGSAVTALAGFVLQDQARPGTLGCALAGLAVLLFAGLTWVDAERHGNQRLKYGAVFAASLASYFAVRYFAITEPQWYVAAPGLTLIAIGLRIPHDARVAVDHSVTQVLTALGVALLFGTTGFEALTDQGWAHTAFLVAEGAAALVAGIGFRSRVLVVAGGAAVGVAALRSLFVLIQSHLLFVAFGAVALVLLALGAAMALLRDQVQEARTGFSDSWRQWN
ncbi:MAG: hypothetical protein NVS9B1_20270 [Candidatus Dormibacteraceae bacterium]